MTNEEAQVKLTEVVDRLGGVLESVEEMFADRLRAEREIVYRIFRTFLLRSRALDDAREFIRTHLVKSDEVQNVRELKHRIPTRNALTHQLFQQALRGQGFEVVGDVVRCSITIPSRVDPA